MCDAMSAVQDKPAKKRRVFARRSWCVMRVLSGAGGQYVVRKGKGAAPRIRTVRGD